MHIGLPVRIGAAPVGHLDTRTRRGYVAVFNEDLVRHYQSFLDRRAFLSNAAAGEALGWRQGVLEMLRQLGAVAGDLIEIVRGVFAAMQTGGSGALDRTVWTENGDGRFVLARRQGDQLPLRGVAVRLSLLPVGPQEGRHHAHASSPRQRPARLRLTHRKRHRRVHHQRAPHRSAGLLCLDRFAWTFTGTRDTASQTLSLGVPLGTDVLSVLLMLVNAGLIDIRMPGPRTLSAWRPGTALLRDLTALPPVELAAGRDISAAPDAGSLEDLASAAYVVGDDSFRVERVNVGALLPWGRWEAGVRQVGVTAATAANLVGESLLVHGAAGRVQRTRELTFARARWLPLRDYLPGDRLHAPGEARPARGAPGPADHSHPHRPRVVSRNLVLDDRLADQEIQVRRRIADMSIRP
ncbi:hypothetical protein [Nonomuraea ceibae]|uniref:hypothetical protein n=1 Tax=Nonomuraea ceibae TaxID=1935170 RepID=UPI001C5E1877|nr:hypothetical protein [Nonomuraea ceibae]